MLGLVLQDEQAQLSRCFPDYSLSEDNVVIITLAHVLKFNFVEKK